MPIIMQQHGINEIKEVCLNENKASMKVMEYCKFIKSYEGIGKYQGEDR